MNYFVWKPEFSVGDEDLDNQHKMIVDVMSDLYELLQKPTEVLSESEVEQFFGKLTGYIVSHFAYEEQRMVDAGYPLDQFAEHRSQHNAFIKTVRTHHGRIQEGDYSELKEMLPYLYGDWLIGHICGTDKAYQTYLDAKKH